LDTFIIGKREERRGEERGGQTKAIGIDENSEQLLKNIE